MPKFMNAELIEIRDNLKCGHCSSIFQGSDSQAWKVKYENGTVYCSATCRKVAQNIIRSKPVPERGPCKKCGKMFKSRTDKKYCCMVCYVSSEQFKETTRIARQRSLSPESIRKRAEAKKTGDEISCLECGKSIYRKKSSKRKFCSTLCVRKYMSDRFDRWVANPENISLPQCYDEFLVAEELPCLVDGCDWVGHYLSVHMNVAHGIAARDFKRAAGFNFSTGVVSAALSEKLQGRDPVGFASPENRKHMAVDPGGARPQDYISLERKEHSIKSRALAAMSPGPERACVFCGETFQQSTPFGKTIYCSIDCRNSYYKQKKKVSGADLKRPGLLEKSEIESLRRGKKHISERTEKDLKLRINKALKKLDEGGR